MANSTGETSSTCIQSLVCEACRRGPFASGSFQQAMERNSDGFSYTTTWGEIKKSADEKCNWCTLLAFLKKTRPGTAIASEPLEGEVKVRLRVDVLSVDDGGVLYLFIDSIPFGAFALYADPEDEAANHIGTGVQRRAELLFPDYNVAKEWIKKCADHECCPKQEKVVLPTRVIDCSQPEKPKLLITPKDLRGHYAALSYVWGRGEKQPQRTTTANVDSYVKGINVSLPQTIVDAMVATRKLDLDYLWVDSLCILDSDDDRKIELPKMQKIYGNAFVTISAASAYGANEGFLKDQQPTTRLPFQCPGEKVGSMLVHVRFVILDERMMGNESGGMNTRAWCFQESILSPRNLFFCRPHMVFTCGTNIYHSMSSGLITIEPQSQDTHLLFPNKPYALSDDQLSKLRTLWHQILGDYSGREMGRASDKLVAIAGVVEAFHRVWGGECIAGLWRETLIEDLLWRRPVYPHYPHFPPPADYLLPRPDYYRAPSWSWAAIDGEIEPHRDHFTGIPSIAYKCKILECKTTPKCNDFPWGEVTDGILRINAKMKEVKWDPNNGKLVEPGSLWNGSEETAADHNTRSKDQVCPDSAEEVTKSSRYVWLVLLRLGKTPSPWAHGLFVVPVAGEDRYRRVGTLRCLREPYWYETTVERKITII